MLWEPRLSEPFWASVPAVEAVEAEERSSVAPLSTWTVPAPRIPPFAVNVPPLASTRLLFVIRGLTVPNPFVVPEFVKLKAVRAPP